MRERDYIFHFFFFLCTSYVEFPNDISLTVIDLLFQGTVNVIIIGNTRKVVFTFGNTESGKENWEHSKKMCLYLWKSCNYYNEVGNPSSVPEVEEISLSSGTNFHDSFGKNIKEVKHVEINIVVLFSSERSGKSDEITGVDEFPGVDFSVGRGNFKVLQCRDFGIYRNGNIS